MDHLGILWDILLFKFVYFIKNIATKVWTKNKYRYKDTQTYVGTKNYNSITGTPFITRENPVLWLYYANCALFLLLYNVLCTMIAAVLTFPG